MEFEVGLPRYGRRPRLRRLPSQPLQRRRQSLRSLFFVRFLLALPEDPLEAFSALFEPVRRALRLLLRLLNGPGMRGGWDSDAGRLVLAVHTAYWARDALRAEEAECLLVVADLRIAVRAVWQDASQAVSCPHAGVRITPRPRRLRRRVDIACTDGSWLTVRASHTRSADQIRAFLAP
ncbi:predicted protein [Streptomyces viridosporus ATCC 14672]|uniref:Predicted protein n=1 Tax=Streptomyces viridosporus (strain ATCC 14672 / DSM 40746 / JCM 4963 / KCTC 9882 / NRRL B-12104 / FH 1290) TaxID=566461 RepID=D6AA58_STRV1|nr:predicted protein [Streptomyces viridosporus ATCC 14672]